MELLYFEKRSFFDEPQKNNLKKFTSKKFLIFQEKELSSSKIKKCLMFLEIELSSFIFFLYFKK